MRKCMRAGVRPGLQILWVCLGGPVGSIPTHFRQVPPRGIHSAFILSTMRPPKRQRFRATKEVKRQARLRVGSPPPAQPHQDRRKKPPKHKGRERQTETESS